MPTKQLWAPWRMDFIMDPSRTKTDECIFCALPRQKSDRENLIVHRAKLVFVILNKYPYNNGHLMICPYLHTSRYEDLPDEQLLELSTVTKHAMRALEQAYRPQGYNIGMNLGAAAGAGIKEHLHLHIVPRWTGDTNFLPVLADTKAMPQHLMVSYDQIYDYFQKL